MKNLRGDAVFGARESRKVAMPPGLNAVFNTVAVQGVWQRLAGASFFLALKAVVVVGTKSCRGRGHLGGLGVHVCSLRFV